MIDECNAGHTVPQYYVEDNHEAIIPKEIYMLYKTKWCVEGTYLKDLMAKDVTSAPSTALHRQLFAVNVRNSIAVIR